MVVQENLESCSGWCIGNECLSELELRTGIVFSLCYQAVLQGCVWHQCLRNKKKSILFLERDSAYSKLVVVKEICLWKLSRRMFPETFLEDINVEPGPCGLCPGSQRE